MAQAPATLERKPICLDGALPFSRAQGNARPAYLPVQEPVGDLKLPSAGFAGVAAAHILLHSKRDIFVDYASGEATEADEEANRWAADFLVPRRQWERFKDCSNLSKMDVVRFAEEQGIAPSIVVGRLQHEGLVPWNRLNQLKARLTWGD